MASVKPYTYIQCPCSDPSTADRPAEGRSPRKSQAGDDERTFDPRAPRSNFSVYPLEHLLYCEDCHQIRCPRCVAEEIVTFYCPACLFEVPSSNIKTEGNRCTRSCFQCPVCIGHLTTVSLESSSDNSHLTAPEQATPTGPYILCCSYCQWSSAEIGIKFDKPNGIHAQLAKVRNGGAPRLSPKERRERRKDSASETGPLSAAPTIRSAGGDAGDDSGVPMDRDVQFSALKAFYQGQASDAGAGNLAAFGTLDFASPTSLSRIMSMYMGSGLGDKKTRTKLGSLREAMTADEGLQVAQLDEASAIEKLRKDGYDETNSTEQLVHQPYNAATPETNGHSRFSSELRPIPYLLRTKRSKRCPVCRHIITKPENKISSTRFRIRLVAGNYIPTIQIRPLSAAEGGSGPIDTLAPLKPIQFLLTFQNPIFESVKVTLAAPSATPGRFSSKVTVFCPQFEIDANTDMWDEALKAGDKDRRQRRPGDETQGEIGKIWDRGRNWVSVVVEVVPSSLRLDLLTAPSFGEAPDRSPLKEDEDLLEVPMFVRVEWEADAGGDDVESAPSRDKETKETRELAYWAVLGLGRISQD